MRPDIGLRSFKDHLRWHLQRALWHVATPVGNGRWLGYGAGVVLIASAVFIWVQVLPLRAQVAQLEADIASATTSATTGVDQEADKSDTHVAPLQESIADLRDRTAILDGMVEAASKHNLYLLQAQYQWLNKPPGITSANSADGSSARSLEARPDQTIYALQWSLPVKGSYRDIREYVGHLLQANPSLALESIALNRDGPMGPRLQADLRFTLYLRGKP